MASPSEKQKTAECVRRVGNWSRIEPSHRFDKKTFNKKAMGDDIGTASPKMDALFQKIRELDRRDMEQDGRVYKHMVYSDVKALGYGAKIIAAAFVANGCTPAYGADFNVSETALAKDPYNNFALLCSTPVYDKPITVRLKNSVLQAFNSRPDNSYGKNIRFLILDQGYKEGIDVFDIRYIHLFEPTITRADEKQAIGRGTRLCGQKGLIFHPQKGWPLYVYRYNSTLTNDPAFKGIPTVHELFLDLSGFDLSKLVLASELERMCILGAVDYELTKNVHSFNITGKGSLYNIPVDTLIELSREPRTLKKQKEKIVLYGREYDKSGPIRCKEGCKGAMHVPTALMILSWMVASNDMAPFYEKNPRWYLCREMARSETYCRTLNTAWKDTPRFVHNHRDVILNSMMGILGSKEKRVVKQHAMDMMGLLPFDMQKALGTEPSGEHVPYLPNHVPPPHKLSFLEMSRYIVDEFGDCKWPKVRLENACGAGGASIVKFTPTQNFIKDYFRPQNPYKGMLLYQTVGTGKTCTAIATATNSFERENYTILWVTRHTLKSDIWKNMFDQVCSLVLQDKMRDGMVMPKELPQRKRLLPPNWIEPISYKQFSNFLSGRNKQLEKVITERNGTNDPLYKTLIIIDEAHKLYAPDVAAAERPDVGILHRMIMGSYRKSGKDSARVLLMTATPYTDDPMGLIKLLNFLREEDDQLPEGFNDFKRAFLDDTGRFTHKGAARFISSINGYISYLNRENDIRQFAYPIIEDVVVPISEAPFNKEKLEKDLKTYERILEAQNEAIATEIPEDLSYIREDYKDTIADCKALPTKDERNKCKTKATEKYKKKREKLDEQLERTKKERKGTKDEIKKIKNNMKLATTDDKSQETALLRDCFKVKKQNIISL